MRGPGVDDSCLFQKLASFLMVCQIVFAIVQSICQTMYYPTYRQKVLHYCLGRYEIFFDFDYFVDGGYGRSVAEFGVNLCQVENPAGRWACNSVLFVGMIVGSNLPEIYLTGKVVIEMKKYTNNASILLSKKAFQARKR